MEVNPKDSEKSCTIQGPQTMVHTQDSRGSNRHSTQNQRLRRFRSQTNAKVFTLLEILRPSAIHCCMFLNTETVEYFYIKFN